MQSIVIFCCPPELPNVLNEDRAVADQPRLSLAGKVNHPVRSLQTVYRPVSSRQAASARVSAYGDVEIVREGDGERVQGRDGLELGPTELVERATTADDQELHPAVRTSGWKPGGMCGVRSCNGKGGARRGDGDRSASGSAEAAGRLGAGAAVLPPSITGYDWGWGMHQRG